MKFLSFFVIKWTVALFTNMCTFIVQKLVQFCATNTKNSIQNKRHSVGNIDNFSFL